ncbi:MAG: bifunctional diaminohydroxyphosphoribosylaminopyrimidine deaminase/5-amino-6-(5-phosphoribosylamino)uracil reductase RibD [Betaproteobacteria bacterium]|nr:MAG: bifunctional diaminohydroxyphosphoribosylaminopyrimidine deaminase/5-amino-6-(5-phosphoribosylamino)uracil reductase RibD [Betaproteobacteria bacterium]
MSDDYLYMARALRLAAKGMYSTTPNPRVGCVIVRDGNIVSQGWHERAGKAHAEVIAIESAGDAARGATVYVTLEPCSHQGRTGPCADALVRAGVGRVVVAMQDPNPQVSGAGIKRLRDAGIAVVCGVLESQARELNIGYVSRMTRGRPWMRVKIASGIDGKTSLENGASQWITSEEARRDAHRWRARSCAIMTGIGTLTSDDPRLTVRNVETSRQPLRVVVDSWLRIPLGSKIFEGGGVLVATANDDVKKIQQITDLGAEVVVVPDQQGKVDLGELAALLAKRGINEVLVEAGINLHSALWRAGVIDELLIYYAPKLLGDRGRGMFDLGNLGDMDAVPALEIEELRQVGPDLRILARLKS